MRARFNTLATFFAGPGTATPGVARLIDCPARFVSDVFFQDWEPPLNDSLAYLTTDVDTPQASVNTMTAAGIWTFDFTKADRVVIASVPELRWIVLRVELCTWPDPGAPYWRCSLALTDPEPPPSECSASYSEVYAAQNQVTFEIVYLFRVSETIWEGGGLTLSAEHTPPGEFCNSEWWLTGGGTTWVTASWGGQVGTGSLFNATGEADWFIYPA